MYFLAWFSCAALVVTTCSVNNFTNTTAKGRVTNQRQARRKAGCCCLPHSAWSLFHLTSVGLAWLGMATSARGRYRSRRQTTKQNEETKRAIFLSNRSSYARTHSSPLRSTHQKITAGFRQLRTVQAIARCLPCGRLSW